ncbi:hypothetical protein [Ferruginibacter sp.]
MDTLKLSDLIGKEIVEIRFHYVPENEYGSQSFHSYIKLSNDAIIGIPEFDNEEYLELTPDNLDYFKMRFVTGEPAYEEVKTYFVGQKITGLFFNYYDNQIDIEQRAFIELANGIYLTENNFGQVGLPDIDLIILDKEEFDEEVRRRESFGAEVRRFEKTTAI